MSTKEEEAEEEAAAEIIDPRELFKQTLIKFYTENDKKYLGKIDYFLKKYLGQEHRILKGLQKKYGKAPAFDLSTLPKPAAAASASAASASGKELPKKMASLALKPKPRGPLTWTAVTHDDIEMGPQVSLFCVCRQNGLPNKYFYVLATK